MTGSPPNSPKLPQTREKKRAGGWPSQQVIRFRTASKTGKEAHLVGLAATILAGGPPREEKTDVSVGILATVQGKRASGSMPGSSTI